MPVRIVSTGSQLPELVVTNGDMAKIVDTSDEWIRTRTGIAERRVAVRETTSSLGAAAARKALEAASLSPADIGLVLCATCTPDYCVPPVSCKIRELLGVGDAVTLDINVECTGFVYALSIASSMMETQNLRYALVIGAEVVNGIVDWTNRATCVLFGDGAGAVVLERGKESASRILDVHLGGVNDADGALRCALPRQATPFGPALEAEPPFVYMNGRSVFAFAVRAFLDSSRTVMERNRITAEEIRWFVPHQANLRIIASAAERMAVPIEKFYTDIDHLGNTGAATIPIALDEMNAAGLLSRGDLLLLVAFGGGLTYGSALVRW